MKRSLINQPFLTETGEFELEERERGEREVEGGGRRTEDGVVMTSKVLRGLGKVCSHVRRL